MGDLVSKVVAALLTIAWASKCNGYQSESEIARAYRSFYEEVR